MLEGLVKLPKMFGEKPAQKPQDLELPYKESPTFSEIAGNRENDERLVRAARTLDQLLRMVADGIVDGKLFTVSKGESFDSGIASGAQYRTIILNNGIYEISLRAGEQSIYGNPIVLRQDAHGESTINDESGFYLHPCLDIRCTPLIGDGNEHQRYTENGGFSVHNVFYRHEDTGMWHQSGSVGENGVESITNVWERTVMSDPTLMQKIYDFVESYRFEDSQ